MRKVPSLNAAFANSIMANALDFDDTFPWGGHPGSTIIPPALAIAKDMVQKGGMSMRFLGYERADGSVGVRSRILVMAVVPCVEPVARMIAEGVEGAVAITQHYGCIRGEMVANTLVGVGKNPNVSGVLLVGMGCEGMPASSLGEVIKESRKPVDWISIQELGGTESAIRRGKHIAEVMLEKGQRVERKYFGVDKLVVGLQCCGSDATSGVAGNPAVGVAVDILIDAGGAAVMMEPLEAVGAEELLAERAISEEVKKKIYKVIGNEEKRWSVPGSQVEFMCRGNVEGGLTTIEEKSLGAIQKSGSRPIKGVLENSYRLLEKVPEGGGLYIQDGNHIEPISFMAAAGVQIVLFVTGCGGTSGHAMLPMINITGNPETYRRMKDDIDINAGSIIEGKESIEALGQRIFNEPECD
jgi:altronate dehydratase large subunit